jgi:hypothetical protein
MFHVTKVLKVCKIIFLQIASQGVLNRFFKNRKMTFLCHNWKSIYPNNDRRVRLRLHPNLRCQWGKKLLECVQTLKFKLSL